MKVHGRCHCGAIRYEAEVDPARAQACHCTDCQRLSGSPFRVSIPAPRESFVLLSGDPRIYVKTADSGNRRAQAFCAGCGSPIYSSALADPPMYSLRVACLDERADLPPRKQIWCRSSLDWAMDVRELPQAERQ
ncbi:MAG TPA: GFA family protein [Casimicrobiaceae bacterium]|nr:GFA family protein [Casimicrobiaceae bacterium]